MPMLRTEPMRRRSGVRVEEIKREFYDGFDIVLVRKELKSGYKFMVYIDNNPDGENVNDITFGWVGHDPAYALFNLMVTH